MLDVLDTFRYPPDKRRVLRDKRDIQAGLAMTATAKWYGDKAKAAVREGGAEGVEAGARLVFEATQRAVPVDTGALKRSGKITAHGLHAEITYGEGLPDARAVIIHEKLDIHHDKGTAKYLENPTTASARRVEDVIAEAVRRKLR